MSQVKRLWTEGTITAWTSREGPTVAVAPPSRAPGRILAAVWGGLIVFLTAVGCPCVEDGTCVEPGWVSLASGVIIVSLIPAFIGLIAHTRWAGIPSAIAAAAGIGPSVWEIGHAAVLGLLELALFTGLFAASVWILIRSRRYVRAVRAAMAEATAALTSAERFDSLAAARDAAAQTPAEAEAPVAVEAPIARRERP